MPDRLPENFAAEWEDTRQKLDEVYTCLTGVNGKIEPEKGLVSRVTQIEQWRRSLTRLAVFAAPIVGTVVAALLAWGIKAWVVATVQQQK